MSVKRNCTTEKSSERQDYRSYRFSKREWLQYFGLGFCGGSLLLYFFYESSWVICMGVPCGILFCRWQNRQLCEKRKQQLEQQFKSWINIVASGLQAGQSVENAFLRSGRELALLYEEKTDIRRELCSMEQLLKNNVTLEKILWDLGQRSGSEDICNFAEVFVAGKRSGGNLREMIENCCEIIVAKMEVEREIRTLIHGKVTEQKIMCLIPFGIMAYISLSSPGYFAPLYHNPAGNIIMTGCLIMYMAAVWLSLRLVRIEV